MTTPSPGSFTGGTRLNAGSQVPRPLLSIVIVVFRDRDELHRIIESIAPHKTPDMEIIVIDGASQDGTVELLQSLDPLIDYWLSEPDSGIYDAMNKGLKAARGEYILHLNAGDRLLKVPWAALRQHAGNTVDVICCAVLIDSKVEFKSSTGLLSKLDNTWHHQGTFYRRAAHLGYDATYRICGDFDLNQRLLNTGCVVQHDPSIVADHQSGGVSMVDTSRNEIYRSVRANFGRHYLMFSRLRFTLMDTRKWFARKLRPRKSSGPLE
jgi:glycosyltransferase involved in cell wall biosynthesis